MSPVTRFKVGLYSGCDSDATDCDVAFNIAIAATMHIIASENFRREDISKLSQQNWIYFSLFSDIATVAE